MYSLSVNKYREGSISHSEQWDGFTYQINTNRSHTAVFTQLLQGFGQLVYFNQGYVAYYYNTGTMINEFVRDKK